MLWSKKLQCYCSDTVCSNPFVWMDVSILSWTDWGKMSDTILKSYLFAPFLGLGWTKSKP